MKKNEKKLNATEQFQRDIMILVATYYSNSTSENVKRALRDKKKKSTQDKFAM